MFNSNSQINNSASFTTIFDALSPPAAPPYIFVGECSRYPPSSGKTPVTLSLKVLLD